MTDFVSEGRAVAAGNGWNWIAQGWELFRRQPGMWIVLMLVFIVIFIVLAVIPVIGSLASFVLGPVFTAGLVIGCRAVEQEEELRIEHLFAGFREHFGTLIAVGLLYLAAIVIISLVAGLATGARMFGLFGGGTVDPGAVLAAATTLLLAARIALALMIPVLMAMWFAPPLVVFHQQSAVAAMKASFAGCLKNMLPFLLYGVILLGLAIVASIPFGLGWLVLGPVIATSIYTAYRDIFFQ